MAKLGSNVRWPRVFRVALREADGTEPRFGTANVFVADGAGEWALPLALNAEPGPRVLHVQDAVTGAEAEAAFTVEAQR